MNFGVIIRSIGERTEKLCYESVKQYIAEDNIHILRNYYPSTKAFLKMFEIAKNQKYDWFLGLDADVVLRKNWFDLFKSKLKDEETNNFFRIHFFVQDDITHTNLVRGNNFYNAKYLELSEKYLKYNIKVGESWSHDAFKDLPTILFTKPESSIHIHFERNHNIFNKLFDEVIGYHSYEQYYSEIFRQYITRRVRDPEYINNNGMEFLELECQKKLLKNNQLDRYVANLAWHNNDFVIQIPNGQILKEITTTLLKNDISEKGEINILLYQFYKCNKIRKFDVKKTVKTMINWLKKTVKTIINWFFILFLP